MLARRAIVPHGHRHDPAGPRSPQADGPHGEVSTSTRMDSSLLDNPRHFVGQCHVVPTPCARDAHRRAASPHRHGGAPRPPDGHRSHDHHDPQPDANHPHPDGHRSHDHHDPQPDALQMGRRLPRLVAGRVRRRGARPADHPRALHYRPRPADPSRYPVPVRGPPADRRRLRVRHHDSRRHDPRHDRRRPGHPGVAVLRRHCCASWCPSCPIRRVGVRTQLRRHEKHPWVGSSDPSQGCFV